MTLTTKQIAQIKKLQNWTSLSFHGNRKRLGALPIEVVKQVVTKKRARSINKQYVIAQSEAALTRSLILWALQTKGTSYHKVMIEGNTGIYLASPEHGHADYNKTRLFDKTEKTIKLMRLFNALIEKA